MLPLPSTKHRILLGVSAALWLACATIPEFVIRSQGTDGGGMGGPGTDGGTPLPEDASAKNDGGVPPDLDASVIDAHTLACADAGNPDKFLLFVTSSSFRGDFAANVAGGPAAAADAICARKGAQLNPCTPWKAVMRFGAIGPSGRITPVDGGWYQVTAGGTPGVQVVTQTDASRPVSAILDENGSAPTATYAWTGGSDYYVQDDCNGWTTSQSDASGCTGTITDDLNWQNAVLHPCGESAAIYCAQQPIP